MEHWKNIQPVILAGGNGTRMYMGLPKPLVHLGGKPMIQHIVEVLIELGFPSITLVASEPMARFQEALAGFPVQWVVQPVALGTGHALRMALENWPLDEKEIFVLYGDTPLLSAPTLRAFLEQHIPGQLSSLSTRLASPTGYGRIIRNRQGEFVDIIEELDASLEEKGIQEVNTGIILALGRELRACLQKVVPNAKTGEYYLTDVVRLAKKAGAAVACIESSDPDGLIGVNTPYQLACAERIYQQRAARKLAEEQGVRFQDAWQRA